MFRRALLLALVPALTFLAGCGDDGDDNTFRPPITSTVIGNVNVNENTSLTLDSGRVAAVGFRMLSGFSYTVSYVRLKLEMDPGEGGSIVVRLFRDSGVNPSAVALAFNDPVLPDESGDPELTTFTPTTFFTLQPDSTYWLVVYNEGPTAVEWTVGTPLVTPTGVAATFLATKVDAGIAPAPPTTSVAFIPQFSVVGVKH